MTEGPLLEALHSRRYIGGFTHTFYRYPAAASPELVRELVVRLSRPEDYVLDPFMGGGTTIVEALAHGRRALGFDVNRLALLIARAKTTPLTARDRDCISEWIQADPLRVPWLGTQDRRAANLPDEIRHPIGAALSALDHLDNSRQRTFVRCALLRIGQWALEARDASPGVETLHRKLNETIQGMLKGLDQFVESARAHGVPKSGIVEGRRLLGVGAVTAADSPLLSRVKGQVRLVLTSPPYPGVHVLYHRWQVRSRKETAAPYWIARHKDGCGPSYYTMGGRSRIGEARYFSELESAFRAVRPLLKTDALVVQIVAFSDASRQLARLEQAMENAGYVESQLVGGSREVVRDVPNRRWYARGKEYDAAREYILFHSLAKGK